MSLSIALAVYNEETTIKKCLEAVYDWADEIVIVDGGSTDKTLEIIKEVDTKKKVKVIRTDNPPMFHINKQKALEACTGDWILQLDADEIVSEFLKLEILKILQDQSVKIKDQNSGSNLPTSSLGLRGTGKSQTSNIASEVAFWIPRLNYFLGKPLTKGGQYPDYTIRLYKKGVAKFPCKSLHEQVDIKKPPIQGEMKSTERNEIATPSARNDNASIGSLSNNLLHYPYRDFAHYLHKWVGYSIEEGERDFARGVRPSLFHLWLYFKAKPIVWFCKTYFRNRGYVDGFPGLVFSLFSALRFIPAYVRIVELSKKKG